MPPAQPRPHAPPLQVQIVAALFGLNAAWRLYQNALPAFAADPDAISGIGKAVASLAVAWGLLALRPWARSVALFVSGVGVLLSAVILGLLLKPEFATGFREALPDPAALVRVLAAMGLLSLLIVLLLRTDSARRAFGGS